MEKIRILVPYDNDDTKAIKNGLGLLWEQIEDRNNNIQKLRIGRIGPI